MKMCLDNPSPSQRLFEMSFQMLPNACCTLPRLFHRDGQNDAKVTGAVQADTEGQGSWTLTCDCSSGESLKPLCPPASLTAGRDGVKVGCKQ